VSQRFPPLNRELASAYAYCRKLAREHYENFPVASALLPSEMRPHIAAIYAFARLADDIVDEGDRPPGERLSELDAWGAQLHAACRNEMLPSSVHRPVFIALTETIADRGLPLYLFDDLLSAFRQDVIIKRYRTWEDVLDYCRRSANPIGRLVLGVAGYADESLALASDALCTALQLANFWQDLAIDWRRGRLYISEDVWEPRGARQADLDAARITDAWRDALGEVTRRTRTFFQAGRHVCDAVHGRLRWELRTTWLGGCRILDKLEATNFEVFRRRPSLGVVDAPLLLWRMMRWN
jgi:squalene synthase HpnC